MNKLDYFQVQYTCFPLSTLNEVGVDALFNIFKNFAVYITIT